jgi:hypothetical protein
MEEIVKKRQRNLVMMGKFYMKMNHLRSLGQSQIVRHMLSEWLGDNIDQFYEDPQIR